MGRWFRTRFGFPIYALPNRVRSPAHNYPRYQESTEADRSLENSPSALRLSLPQPLARKPVVCSLGLTSVLALLSVEHSWNPQCDCPMSSPESGASSRTAGWSRRHPHPKIRLLLPNHPAQSAARRAERSLHAGYRDFSKMSSPRCAVSRVMVRAGKIMRTSDSADTSTPFSRQVSPISEA